MKKKEITFKYEARDYDSPAMMQRGATQAREKATEEFMRELINSSEPLQEVEWKEETFSDSFSITYVVTISYVEWSREVTRVTTEEE